MPGWTCTTDAATLSPLLTFEVAASLAACCARGESRPDGQPAEVPELGALLVGLAEGGVVQDGLAYVVAEEAGAADGRDASAVRLADLQLDRDGDGLRGLVLGDVADGGHAQQHGVATLGRLLRVVDRVVARRRLDEAGQHRRLLQLQVLGVLGEVALGGRLDPVGLLPEERDVEVVLQDLLLAEFLLDLDRVLELTHLAAQGLLGGLGDLLRVVARLLDEDVLHVLLGEGRGALRGAALLHVAVHRAQDALEVHRAVLVEARVLDRDDRVLHVRGDVLERDDGAVTRVVRRDEPALVVQDRDPLAQRRGLEVGRISSNPRPSPWPRARVRRRPAARCPPAQLRRARRHRGTWRPAGSSSDPRLSASLAWGQPTFSFAGHTYRPWPKLLPTVTAVRFCINPPARPSPEFSHLSRRSRNRPMCC